MSSISQMPLSGFKGINNSSGTALLVDPDAKQRRTTAIFLRRCGCSVIVTSDGQEAKQVLNTHGITVNLLLTEIRLPTTNGIVLSQELSAEWPELKTLFASREPFYALSRTYGDLLPPQSFLQRPLIPERVMEALSSVLGS